MHLLELFRLLRVRSRGPGRPLLAKPQRAAVAPPPPAHVSHKSDNKVSARTGSQQRAGSCWRWAWNGTVCVVPLSVLDFQVNRVGCCKTRSAALCVGKRGDFQFSVLRFNVIRVHRVRVKSSRRFQAVLHVCAYLFAF